MEPALIGGHVDGETYSGIIGEPRYLPLYDSVTGNGANSKFTIRRFVGVKVVGASLKSGKKWITLQPVTSASEFFSLHIVE